ncbi:putative oxidoreductase subunit [Pseudooceanicola batsensis HTCC2597]|uniref:Putative oxidoreductase subunit n=1 Tax=Pseudooceanicola batsensis (strain ATCC BAA-863 / DSM 15984 / KCTC 12145 / HTCC2597) TaxID=252305 RepID=A3U0I3_PSEBH|nr:xanthine dehydrogenase family protein subunit M [Pseudooceanicola batsensis]EAQ02274.1 putative oxidoreductase subunit [Pseudooceanicola batsensis HTCC2597]
MRPFDFTRPDDLEGACAAGFTEGATFIGGGTNLIDLMKLEVMAPAHVVDVTRLGLDRIEDEGDGLNIGATVRNADLAADPRVRRRYPVLSRALLAGASGQLRNRATTAGNLLQRTRCPYFQDRDSACNKRTPGAGCAALGGEVRNHAILGTSEHCIALHPSDMAVAMRALDAEIEVRDPEGGMRSMDLDHFYRLPRDTPHIETRLEPGDLITSVRLPAPKGDRQIYRKVRDRASYAFALVSVAAVLRMEGGKIAHAAVAFGGIGTEPWRDIEVDAMLTGETPSDSLFDKAGEVLVQGADVQDGTAFKVPLVQRVLKDVLWRAVA